MQKNVLTIHTDGGSRGNPGPAACAFIAEQGDRILKKQSKYLGKTTNNIAEYEGVILALNWLYKKIKDLETDSVDFFLDSELVVKQLNGIYKIKNVELYTRSCLIKKIIGEIGKIVSFKNIPREENIVADLLLNNELDRH